MEIGATVAWTIDTDGATIGTLEYVTSDEWGGVRLDDGTVNEYPMIQLAPLDF